MTKRGRPRHPELLTPREQEVLSLLREGLTNPQIAERLGIGLEGVKYHVSEILSKLQVSTREEAARWREDRPWWLGAIALWRPPLRATSIVAAGGVVVAAAVGLVVLGVLLWRGWGGDEPVSVTGATPTPIGRIVFVNGATPGAAETALATLTPGPQDSFRSVYFVDAQHGWVSGALGGQGVILATVDGGESWQEQYTGGQPVGGLQFVSPLVGWATTNESLLHTANGGESWSVINASASELTSVTFVDDLNGRAILGAYREANVVNTSDAGRTWTEVGSLPQSESLCFNDRDNGWAVSQGQIVQTADGGKHWNRAAISADLLNGDYFGWRSPLGPWRVWCGRDGEVWALVICCAASSHAGYGVLRLPSAEGQWMPVLGNVYPEWQVPSGSAVGSSLYVAAGTSAAFFSYCGPCQERNFVQLTNDGGSTWTETRAVPMSDFFVSASFVDSNVGWVVVRQRDSGGNPEPYPVILATTDGGQTWEQQYP